MNGNVPLKQSKPQTLKDTMKLTKLHLALAIGAAMFTTSAIAGPGPGGGWPTGFPTHVTTRTSRRSAASESEGRAGLQRLQNGQ